MTLAEQQLRLYVSLPPGHQRAVNKLIWRACHRKAWRPWMSKDEAASAAAELFSEVTVKLLGAANRNPSEYDTAAIIEAAASYSVPGLKSDLENPENDERVQWLVQGTTNWKALKSRDEDIRREAWGRHGKGGYRLHQVAGSGEHGEDIGEIEARYLREHADPSYPIEVEQPDIDRAPPADDPLLVWLGLLVMAEDEFLPGDDAVIVLNLLDERPDIREAFDVGRPGAGTDAPKWPVGAICSALNAARPNIPWTGRRVENAQAKIGRWLKRIKRELSLKDNADLSLLFAAVGRKRREETTSEKVDHA